MSYARDPEGDVDLRKEFDDAPPRLASNIGFWLWHGFCWFFYGLVTLIYVPWALAMHVVLAALAVPMIFICCWRAGRQVFLYAYVITVMLPGKFLWANLFRRNRRRARIWDFEMGKPRAIPLQKRRRLSVSDQSRCQPTSQLLSKLPPEIRLHIYKHVFVGRIAWFNVMEGEVDPAKMKLGKPNFKTSAYPCLFAEGDISEGTKEAAIRSLHRIPMICKDLKHLSNAIALLRTCRQVYLEGINFLYSLPAFSFRGLHRPPFFIRSALPQRLACIRTIHLVYDQMNMGKMTHVGCNTAKYCHQVGQCTFCNPIQWLNGIKRYMTGLKRIEVYMFMEKKQPLITMGDAWVARMLDLQIGPNGLREMKIDVSPKEEDHFDVSPSTEAEYVKKVKRLDELMQQRLERGIERYAASQRTDFTGPSHRPPASIKLPPKAHTKEIEDIQAMIMSVP